MHSVPNTLPNILLITLPTSFSALRLAWSYPLGVLGILLEGYSEFAQVELVCLDSLDF